jgi:hypothetical protein
MAIDLIGARAFMAAQARILDRRRLELLEGRGDPSAVLAALGAYRNPDGGYGRGLEPDLRAPESQPAAALHAFEVFAEIAPKRTPEASQLCDWLGSIALPDGGLPFALPIEDPIACAPFFAEADPTVSSLQITLIVAANATRVAAHDPAVAAHPWRDQATSHCLAALDALEGVPTAYELLCAIRFLDAVYEESAVAAELLSRLAEHLPKDGRLRVQGGLPDESLWPLDLAPVRGRPARTIVSEAMIASDLERLVGEQREDGGWSVDFQSYSPAAAMEWRGYKTLLTLSTLRDNGLTD